MSILDRIIAHKRWEVAASQRILPEADLRDRARQAPRIRDFAAALRRGKSPRVVAEFKRASPSRGAIHPAADPAVVACDYAEAGAVALSVLTDARWFWGSLTDLWRVREDVAIPILRKDFLVAPYQVVEARAWGADAVLLLSGVLEGSALAEMASLARDLGMSVVVEAHDEAALERALSVPGAVVGINNRDLRTMTIAPGTAERLRPRVPSDRLTLGESGIQTREDLARISEAGLDAALVGESLMSTDNPGAALKALLQR
jgi:indole-3-glycerol phosphate synthase